MTRYLPLNVLLALLLATDLKSQSAEHCALFYNVENLFHPADDTTSSADNEFTPEGIRNWSHYRYKKKIASICKIILASNQWQPPGLIGLCEIENKKVLEDIVFHPLLINYEYRIIHRDGDDHRGMEVSILYRPDMFRCIDTSFISIRDREGKKIRTRDILAAEFANDNDTLLFVVNHWTSKYSGAYETEETRMLQASILGNYVTDAMKRNPGLHIIITGDLNENSQSAACRKLVHSCNAREVIPVEELGTYKYQGKWMRIDHFYIAGKLRSENCSAAIASAHYLLEEDPKYTGRMPYRTYRGYAYNGGISDHLPLKLLFLF
ncbi:MAG: hypothetical protein K9J30_06085 [Bacteroidales bacterium]|nr:hypothetical protein [Bacteroidales bacterium]